MKRIIWIVLSSALMLGMGFSIVRLVTSASPTVPRPEDKAVAGRVVRPPPGSPEAVGADLRVAAPPGGADVFIGGNGVVEPDREEIAVAPEVAGRVARVVVVEGARVEAGDVLVELASDLERAAVEVAVAELEAAQARRDRVLQGSRAEDVRAAIADSREAAARARLSRGVFERTEALVQGGAATVDELERAQRQSEADAFAARAAEARRAKVVNGNRAEDVAEVEAEVRVAEARLAEARARLEARTLRAPEAGEVLQVKARVGEHVQPGGESPIVIGDTRHLTVRVDVDERDYARVAIGAKVTVRARAFGDRDFVGTVRSVGRRMGRKNVRTDDPTERNDTKILEVVVALEPLDGAVGLVVGQRVTAMIAAPDLPIAKAP